MNPYLSLVTPVYNGADYIDQNLRAILATVSLPSHSPGPAAR